MPELIFIAIFALFAFLLIAIVLGSLRAIGRWNQAKLERNVRPLTREQMAAGFKPSSGLAPKSLVWLTLGLAFAALAIGEWQSPTTPPFSGRWAGLDQLLFQAFGPSARFWTDTAIAAVCILYGWFQWLKPQSGAPSANRSRQIQDEFTERGLRAREEAHRNGDHVDADTAMQQLQESLDAARKAP